MPAEKFSTFCVVSKRRKSSTLLPLAHTESPLNLGMVLSYSSLDVCAAGTLVKQYGCFVSFSHPCSFFYPCFLFYKGRMVTHLSHRDTKTIKQCKGYLWLILEYGTYDKLISVDFCYFNWAFTSSWDLIFYIEFSQKLTPRQLWLCWLAANRHQEKQEIYFLRRVQEEFTLLSSES